MSEEAAGDPGRITLKVFEARAWSDAEGLVNEWLAYHPKAQIEFVSNLATPGSPAIGIWYYP